MFNVTVSRAGFQPVTKELSTQTSVRELLSSMSIDANSHEIRINGEICNGDTMLTQDASVRVLKKTEGA